MLVNIAVIVYIFEKMSIKHFSAWPFGDKNSEKPKVFECSFKGYRPESQQCITEVRERF